MQNLPRNGQKILANLLLCDPAWTTASCQPGGAATFQTCSKQIVIFFTETTQELSTESPGSRGINTGSCSLQSKIAGGPQEQPLPQASRVSPTHTDPCHSPVKDFWGKCARENCKVHLKTEEELQGDCCTSGEPGSWMAKGKIRTSFRQFFTAQPIPALLALHPQGPEVQTWIQHHFALQEGTKRSQSLIPALFLWPHQLLQIRGYRNADMQIDCQDF